MEQSETPLRPRTGRIRRQADLRRAISSAYHALFHTITKALADELIGSEKQATIEYQLAYRGVSHRSLKQLCEEAAKPTPGRKMKPYLPEQKFSPKTRSFAAAVPKLQEARHGADYDPLARFKAADVQAAIDQSREVINRFNTANSRSRRRFLALLAFASRSTGE